MISKIIKKEIGQYALQYEFNSSINGQIAYARVDFFPHMPHFKWALISNLYVSRKYRRQGFATALLQKIIADICTKDRGLYLLVSQDNTQAISVYLNLGFQKVREYQFPNTKGKYYVLAYGDGDKNQLMKVDFSN